VENILRPVDDRIRWPNRSRLSKPLSSDMLDRYHLKPLARPLPSPAGRAISDASNRRAWGPWPQSGLI
jgi:hypothetical protein